MEDIDGDDDGPPVPAPPIAAALVCAILGDDADIDGDVAVAHDWPSHIEGVLVLAIFRFVLPI
jgi:hypothetical protein